MTITQPSNNAVFDSLGSTVTFQGSVSTTNTSGLYFGWFNTQAPWVSEKTDFATKMAEARINSNTQGTSALSFSTNSPGGGSWGMGTQWIQFACKNTSSETDLTLVTRNGFDGGREEITLASWTVYPRKIHILNASILHPASVSRFECDYGPGNCFPIPVQIYWEVRPVMSWITSGTSKNTHAVSAWPGDSDLDDELVFELHSGSIGTYGDAIFKSDTDSSVFVCDLDTSHTTFNEYGKYCLNWAWNTSAGTKTLYLLVYHQGSRATTGSGCTSTSYYFYAVDSCPPEP